MAQDSVPDIIGSHEVKHKNRHPVVHAQRERGGVHDFETLRQSLISGLQKQSEAEEPEEDMMELLAADSQVAGVPYEAPAEPPEEDISVEGGEDAGAADEADRDA